MNTTESVFSAQAEVFLFVTVVLPPLFRFLRASGGASEPTCRYTESGVFSPRKRRCFHLYYLWFWGSSVFSAQAEVFPLKGRVYFFCIGFLRASGGVSIILAR